MATKYDTQLIEVKAQLGQAKKIVVLSPAVINVDKLAASLALFLALKQAGKEVTVVTEGTLKVEHSNLYGVGEIKQSLPQVSGGDLTLILENVVDNQGKVPSLEKLDWYPEGNNLNLVFHVLPGQKFEPSKIESKFSGAAFDLIFVVGANNLSELGNIYPQNAEIFNKSFVVSIDNNGSFGKANVVDSGASSISEMMTHVISGLDLSYDPDIASNLVAGIYDATSNLTVNLKPDTFMALGFVTQQGGKLPQLNQTTQPYPYDMSQFLPKEQPVQPQTQPVVQTPVAPQMQPADNFITPQVVNQSEPVASANEQSSFVSQNDQSSFGQQNIASQNQAQPVASQNEERPHGEAAYSGNPEAENPAPDWLTPKIFKV